MKNCFFSRSTITLFFGLFIPLLAVFTASYFLFYFSERTGALEIRRNQENALVNDVRDSIAHDLQAQVGFLLLMSRNPTVNQITKTSDVQERLALASHFMEETVYRYFSDKIFIFGEGLQEAASLDYTAEPPLASTSPHPLSECDRELVRTLYNMKEGQVFLSPHPYGCDDPKNDPGAEPMVYLGTPVFDVLGQVTGAVLLRVSFGEILARRDSGTDPGGRVMFLLDEFGNYYPHADALAHMPSAATTWWDPEARRSQIREKSLGRRTGQIYDQDGLVTFLTIWPRMEAQRFLNLDTTLITQWISAQSSENYSLKIFSFVPREGIEATPRRISGKLLVFGVILILICGNGCWHLSRSIIKRREAADAMASSERHYRILAESADDMIFIVDRKGDIQYMNFAAAEVTSRRTGSRTRVRLEDLFSEAASNDLVNAMDQVFATGGSRTIRNRMTASQKSQWFETRMVPIKSEDGGITAVMGVSRDITEREKSAEQIKTTLKEKEVLLKEIHHRVKNNLHAVSGLLCLQAHPDSSPELVARIKASQNRVLSMALVHEKLYQSSGLGRIDFVEYLRSLTDFLLRSYLSPSHNIEVSIAAQEVSMNLDTAIPCGLIVNELLSNAFKYAFPDRAHGKVSVEMSKMTNGRFGLVISDDGVGLPPNPGVDASSLGLKLVRDLVEQLGGRLDIDCNKGTCFRISFSEYAECGTVLCSTSDETPSVPLTAAVS